MLTLPGRRLFDGPAPAAPDISAIFQEHRGFVWRMLTHLGVPPPDRDDVMQEVFLVVHRRIGSYQEQDKMRAWLNAIVVRVVKDYRRRLWRRREHVTDVPPEHPHAPFQERAIEVRRAIELARDFLAKLPEKQRMVFVLYELEQMSMTEVAMAMGCSVHTAYARLRKAQERIRAMAARSKFLTRGSSEIGS